MDLDALMARYSEGVTEAQKREARQQALAAAGFAMLGANTGGGWQGAARALGRGGLLGMGAYNQALGDAAQAPLQQLDVYSKFAQLKAQEQKVRESEEAKRSSADFSQQLSGVFGAGPHLGNMGPGGPTPANAQRVAPPSQIEKYRQAAAMYAARGDTEGAKRLADIADRMEGEYSTNPQIGMGPNGAQFAQFSNKGGMRTVEGFAPPPDMQILNLGGKQVAIDKRATAPGAEFGVTMDPAQRDASARGWAGLNQQKAEFGYRKEQDTKAGAIAGKPSDQQLAAQSFLDRMQNASKTLTKFEKEGYAPGIPASLVDASGNIPIIGGMTKGVGTLVGNWVMPQTQLYRQAQEEWVRAKLRKESGAVIGANEMNDEVRTYFPQAGDSAEMIQQKARARAVAEQSIANQASGVRQSQASSQVAGGREASGNIKQMSDDALLRSLGF